MTNVWLKNFFSKGLMGEQGNTVVGSVALHKLAVALLIMALASTYVAVPLYTYVPAIYGSPSVMDMGFVKDYIVSWWQKIVRRYVYGQTGPAENATVNTEQAKQYSLPATKTTGEPTNVYELIDNLKQNKAAYSTQILTYLRDNNIPNKSTQIDLFIVPENIYVTLVWNEVTLEIYGGWIGDQNCREYIEATATSTLIMNIYQNRGNIETCKALILNAEANGDFSYSLKRINPTISEVVLYLEAFSSIVSMASWVLLLKRKLLSGEH